MGTLPSVSWTTVPLPKRGSIPRNLLQALAGAKTKFTAILLFQKRCMLYLFGRKDTPSVFSALAMASQNRIRVPDNIYKPPHLVKPKKKTINLLVSAERNKK